MAQSPVAPWPTLAETQERARSVYRYSDRAPLLTSKNFGQILHYPGNRMHSNAYVSELLTCFFGEGADFSVDDFMAKGFTWQVRDNGGPSCLVPADGVVHLALAPNVADLLANMILSNVVAATDSDIPAGTWSATRWYYEAMVLWAGLVAARYEGHRSRDVTVMYDIASHGRHFEVLNRAKVGPIAFTDLRTAVDLATTTELDRLTRPGAWLHEDDVFGVFMSRMGNFAQIGLEASGDPFFAALVEVAKSSQPEARSNVVPIPMKRS